jgi:hypothetical protein
MRSIVGVSETRRPRGLRRPARVALVLAWVVFWLNTALFPCCEALAVAFGDHSDSVSEPTHHSDETHSEQPHHSPGSPCGHSLNAGPAINGECEGLPTDRVYLEWFAVDVSSSVGLTVVNHSTILALREPHPPPFRLYLRTLRLLI